MSRAERIAGWVWDHGALLAMLLAAVSFAAVLGALRVGVDNSLRVWFVEDDPQLVAYQRFRETFGSDEVVVVALGGGDMRAEPGLALLRRAEASLRSVEGIASVHSIASLEGRPLPGLLSADGATAAVVARMEAGADADRRRDEILARVDDALATLGTPTSKAGIGVLYAALNRIAIVDAFALFAVALGVMFLVLWAILRRAAPAAAALALAGIAAAWTLGLYGAAGRDLNMVTTVMPTVVVVVGVAEMVHVLMRAGEMRGACSRREKALAVMGALMLPCALNVFTSAVGFASLAFSPLPAVRDLGLFTAAGLLGCLVLTVVGGTLLMRWPRFEPRIPAGGWLARTAEGLSESAMRRPVATLAACALLALAGVAATSRIVVDTFTLGFLDPAHPVRRDAMRIEDALGPYIPLDFTVRSRDGSIDAGLLRAVKQWQRAAERLPGVGWSLSACDDLEALGPLPENGAALELRLAAYRAMPLASIDRRIAGDGTLRVTFSIRNQSAASAAGTVEAIRNRSRLPPGTRLEAAGYIPVYIRMIDYIVDSQVSGFAVAFVAVFGIIAVAMRSTALALLAIPSNFIPLLAVLATMALAGIRLDAATATIASVVLGLVVDDTVHLLHRLRAAFTVVGDPAEASRIAVRQAGRPILVVALVLAIGFSVFGFSEIGSVVDFGLLIALAMGAGVIADLVVVPALVASFGARLSHAYRPA